MAPTEASPSRRPGWRDRLRELRKRRAVRWGLDLAVIAAAVLAVGAFQTRGHLATGTAPAVALPSLSGGTVSLESLRGKPVLVAFWAPWCSVCGASSANVSWARRIAGDRAHVISVAAAFGDVDEVRAWVREREVDYPVLLGDDEVVRSFGVAAFPTVYFLDADGRVKRSAAGYTTTAGLLLRLFF